MKFIKDISILIILTVLLTSCSNMITDQIGGCPDAEIEWVDLLMINDIKYEHQFPDQPDEQVPLSLEKGKEIGKVSYMMADRACSDHLMKNGDAAYLEIGTPIYEVKGYPSSFIVMADDKVYVVQEYKKAKTSRELYPLRGLVKNIHVESTEDGRRIHTFSSSSTDKFIDEWYKLKLESYDKLNQKKSFEGERIFLEIELNNGASFRLLYWIDTNTFNNGIIGNKEIKEIVTNELSNVKSH